MLLGHSAANTSAARMTIGHSAGSTSGVVMHIGHSAAYTFVVRMRGGHLCGQHVCGENAGRPIRGQLVRSEHADRRERPASCFFFVTTERPTRRMSRRPGSWPVAGISDTGRARPRFLRRAVAYTKLFIVVFSGNQCVRRSRFFLSRPNATFDRRAVPSH